MCATARTLLARCADSSSAERQRRSVGYRTDEECSRCGGVDPCRVSRLPVECTADDGRRNPDPDGERGGAARQHTAEVGGGQKVATQWLASTVGISAYAGP